MSQEIEGNQVIKAIDTIYQKGNKSKFSPHFQQSVAKESKIICEYLGIESTTQSIFWAILFSMSIEKNSSIDIDDFSMYLGITVLRVFTFQSHFDELVKRKLILRQKTSRRRRCSESLNYLSLYVPGDIIHCVVTGTPLSKRRKSDLSFYEILDIVFNLFEQKDNGYIDMEEFVSEIEALTTENKKQPIVRQILNFKLPSFELGILLVILQQFTEGYQSIDLVKLSRTFLNDTNKQIHFRKEFMSGNTKLQKLNLVDLETESTFRSDKTITLTQKGKELFGEDKNLFMEQESQQQNDIIQSSSIIEQKLFFNEREKKEIDTLTKMLIPAQYNEIVHRLKKNKMKGNFTILFSGQAGTGKTELVYQIAKVTGRDIKRVDISQTKSKWFGESEKRIKAVFDSYKKLVKNSSLTPILLFNEADGVFGTRKTLGNSSVDQTENAIQTIILQEMEDFEGIMIATTNLPTHLKEFERRLLFKIAFNKPNSSTRLLIMQDKIPFLTVEQIQQLSERYSLTGGQVMNISKKLMMNQILTGNTPSMCEILEMCEAEFLVKKEERNPIGFKIMNT
ncbi:MAG: ATP-binding protein [Bacteroidota bacterium]